MDPSQNKVTFRHQLESKALGVAPNPVDYNLVMVQTGSVSFVLANLSYCVCNTEVGKLWLSCSLQVFHSSL